MNKYLRKSITLVFVSSFIFLSGCGKEVFEDRRMSSQKDQGIELEYRIYNVALVDSGYNWFSEYLGDFISSLNEVDYKLNPKIVEKKIQDVETKKDQINGIDIKSVRKMMSKVEKNISEKEVNDPEFHNMMIENKSNVENNIKYMDKILDLIKSGLKLGLDGEYSKEDLQKINSIQSDIIEINDKNIKYQNQR
ncbi:hypothetical protein [Peptostreptococcus canis]|uniref:Lipoprotein n=1 Tax=Peptostreptococcus canis TaxID=1159213 RepID=A0ABR6TNB9_9FIRM|nr:hypothetical protein [Peptostreptococcus canis]MBC2576461.1 hypothetical protein [Peptostreptococcus canis]MBP1998703.1 hypothetical protein [Peptostreptococcus canis]